MKVELILDPSCGEPEVTVRAAARTAEVEDLLRRLEEGPAGILGFREDRAVPLIPGTVLRFYGEDKGVLAQTEDGVWRVRLRLYELEAMLPASFIRINKSALANEAHLERFTASFNGAVDAVFRSGYREYVSRRCFAEIKRRYDHV